MVIYTPSTSFLVGMKTSRRSPLLPRTFLGDLILFCPCLRWHQQNQCLCFAHDPSFMVVGKLSQEEVRDGHEGYPEYVKDTWSSINWAHGKTLSVTLAGFRQGAWTKRNPAIPLFSAPRCGAGDKEPTFSLWHHSTQWSHDRFGYLGI